MLTELKEVKAQRVRQVDCKTAKVHNVWSWGAEEEREKRDYTLFNDPLIYKIMREWKRILIRICKSLVFSFETKAFGDFVKWII